jgi:hypothetical protein
VDHANEKRMLGGFELFFKSELPLLEEDIEKLYKWQKPWE